MKAPEFDRLQQAGRTLVRLEDGLLRGPAHRAVTAFNTLLLNQFMARVDLAALRSTNLVGGKRLTHWLAQLPRPDGRMNRT